MELSRSTRKMVDTNKSSLGDAAKLTGSREALTALRDAVKEHLPEEYKKHADSPLFLLVVGNLANQAIPLVTDSRLAKDIADKILVSAYQQVLEDLGIVQIVKKLLKATGAAYNANK
jgi:hypothetical protein